MSYIKDFVFKPYHANLELLHLVRQNFNYIARSVVVVLLTFLLASITGYHSSYLRCSTWILLGVASSIGLGFGMHTFVLFLGPHIAKVTMAASACGSLNFLEPPYPEEIVCPGSGHEEVTYFRILQKIGLESFMWGLGTAIGELPPYLMGRLRGQTINHRHGGDNLEQTGDVAWWELQVIKVVHKIGFIGILLCAAIPNPLFDAAGIASGIAGVPFVSFFGATVIGKAIIKVTLQSSFVILAFHNKNLDNLLIYLIEKVGEYFPAINDLNLNDSVVNFLEEQRSNILSRELGEPKKSSIVALVFHWITCACIALFAISLINGLDKQYRERTAPKPARRNE